MLTPRKLSAAELAALTPATFDLANIYDDRAAFAEPKGCFVVVQDGAAYAACGGFREVAPGTCEIQHFVVSYEYRGRGLGSLLMRTLLSAAQQAGYNRVLSYIEPGCPEWRAFYRAHGFAFEDGESGRPGPAALDLAVAQK